MESVAKVGYISGVGAVFQAAPSQATTVRSCDDMATPIQDRTTFSLSAQV